MNLSVVYDIAVIKIRGCLNFKYRKMKVSKRSRLEKPLNGIHLPSISGK